MENDGFQIVSSKNRRRKPLKRPPKEMCMNRVPNCDEVDVDKLKDRIHLVRSEVQGSNFYSQLLEKIQYLGEMFPSSCIDCLGERSASGPERAEGGKTVPHGERGASRTECVRCRKAFCRSETGFQEMLCYGVGSFSQSPSASFQLALFLLLMEDLKISPDKSYIYDPIFSSQEIEILKDYHLQVIPENEEGRRRCGPGCLVFMPHCGKALFNNLLWANWGTHLSQLVLLGNSFASFVDRTPARLLRQTGNLILSIQPYMREDAVDNTFHHTDIFNDLSLHWFPADSVATAEPAFLEAGSPPRYDEGDPEIITNTLGDHT